MLPEKMANSRRNRSVHQQESGSHGQYISRASKRKKGAGHRCLDLEGSQNKIMDFDILTSVILRRRIIWNEGLIIQKEGFGGRGGFMIPMNGTYNIKKLIVYRYERG